MDDIPAQNPPHGRPHRLAELAAVIVGGVLAWVWLPLSLSLFLGAVGAIPAAGIGVLMLIPWLLLMRGANAIERSRAASVHGLAVVVPPRRRSGRPGLGGWLQDLWFDACSGQFWRGVLHHHLALLCAGMFTLAALVLAGLSWNALDIALRHGPLDIGVLTLPVWALIVVSAVIALLALGALVLGALADRALARAMLTGHVEELREQVVELTEQRQGAVDAAAQERLRIERDLHDGVQPRLVALAMTLGMARSAIESDPERARRLVDEAHGEAKAVMGDLRQLARGIHPAVLTDRGLDAALSALAARSAVPVDLTVDLPPQRLGREREGVAYFVVAEALTNIAKHAEARGASVDVRIADGALRVLVEDDGRGGARVHRDGVSTGLAGLSDRVRATGGRLEVASPEGVGTRITASIPLPASALSPAGAVEASPAVAEAQPAPAEVRPDTAEVQPAPAEAPASHEPAPVPTTEETSR